MINNREWLNYNRTRKYPLKTGTTGGLGVTKIPNEFLVDAVFAEVPRGDRIYLSDITRLGQKITLVFKTELSLETISVVINGNLHSAFDTYSATGGTDNRMFAAVVIADISTILTIDLTGGASYGLGETEFELRCIQFGSEDAKVTALFTQDDGILLRGNVELRAGVGLKLTTDVPNNAIKIEFDSLVNVPDDCACPPNFPFVRTINGLTPDCTGNFCINADGFNVVENDGNCLTVNTVFEPNQICIIESGIPGPQGSQGPRSSTKPGGGGGLCCEVAADISCCESCLESCITKCEGDPLCEETCCSSCFIICGGLNPICPPIVCPCPQDCINLIDINLDLININISCCDSLSSEMDSVVSAASTLESEVTVLITEVDQNTSDISTTNSDLLGLSGEIDQNSTGISTINSNLVSVCVEPCGGGGNDSICSFISCLDSQFDWGDCEPVSSIICS